jgi:hypothetical protein
MKLIPIVSMLWLAMPAAQAHSTTWPDTCLQGHVWREAVAGDHVCVPPASRARAAADNREAPSRSAGAGACRAGFVARRARHDDLMCVTPEVRAQTERDNAQAQQHTVPPAAQRRLAERDDVQRQRQGQRAAQAAAQ